MRFLLFIIGFSLFFPLPEAKAASQDECAIWLCLPGGFPDGCGGAKSAMYKRLKKRKPPLPSFGSCASGESGHYNMGMERFEPCKAEYELVEQQNEGNPIVKADCINMTRECVGRRMEIWNINTGKDCSSYSAIKRPKPYFVEMWAGGEYIGKYFYQ